MLSETSPEPEQRAATLYVGQDHAGHWLVQDSAQRIEGRFVSFTAAMSFARAEGQIYHAEVALASMPLTPLIPFAPLAAHERVLSRAA